MFISAEESCVAIDEYVLRGAATKECREVPDSKRYETADVVPQGKSAKQQRYHDQ